MASLTSSSPVSGKAEAEEDIDSVNHSSSSAGSTSQSGPTGSSHPSTSSLQSQSSQSSSSEGVESGPRYFTHKSGIIPICQNVVATVHLGCKLDLKEIALKARNAEYNPKRFAAVIIRIRDPKTTCLVFSSGKIVITGAKSENLARLAARKYARIVQKLKFPARFEEFKVQNIVCSCSVNFPIRLEGLAFEHATYSSYEPELFPGLIYRMVSPKVVLLVFVSGKIIITGAKTREETYQAFENLYPVLLEYRKEDS
eukprot:239206_1